MQCCQRRVSLAHSCCSNCSKNKVQTKPNILTLTPLRYDTSFTSIAASPKAHEASLLPSSLYTAITAAVCWWKPLLSPAHAARQRKVGATQRQQRLDRVRRKHKTPRFAVESTHWSLVLQDGRFPWLVFKDALGLCAVLARVHFGVGRSPLVPGAANNQHHELTWCGVCDRSLRFTDVLQLGR